MFWGTIQPNQGKENEVKKHPDIIEMSKGEQFLASCMNIFRHAYGFVEATNKGLASDKDGNFLPLYTYPTIEYLNQFDFSAKKVFEFGAGASTFFWMLRAEKVVSIENNAQWFNKVKQQVNARVELIFSEGDKFPFEITDRKEKFDIIIVDGGGYRYDCAVQAIDKLADGGMIILDNADWHPNTAKVLKDSGLLQVDMTGFKPCESHTSTTSIFFHRQFDFPTLKRQQPSFGMGAKHLHSTDWDKPYAKRK